MLGSQDTVSYLAPAAATSKDTITSTMRPGRGLREPSAERGRQVGGLGHPGAQVDLSLVYSTAAHTPLNTRARRCQSEDRSVVRMVHCWS